MQIDLINKYFILKEDGKNILKIHKLGTSHAEALERFILIESKFDINTLKTNDDSSSLFMRMLLNPNKKNVSKPLSVSAIRQYIRVLLFYGMISIDEFIDHKSFTEINKQIENGTLSISVNLADESQFKTLLNNYISGCILTQIFHDNDEIRINARTILNTIILLNIFKEKELELTIENLEIILEENEWTIHGLRSGELKKEKVIECLGNFKKGPFGTGDEFYIEILNRINLSKLEM